MQGYSENKVYIENRCSCRICKIFRVLVKNFVLCPSYSKTPVIKVLLPLRASGVWWCYMRQELREMNTKNEMKLC